MHLLVPFPRRDETTRNYSTTTCLTASPPEREDGHLRTMGVAVFSSTCLTNGSKDSVETDLVAASACYW